MALIKKNTISRVAFEKEMESIKRMLNDDADKYHVIMAINKAMGRLIELTDKEEDDDPFKIPDWINQNVTVTVQVKQNGDII